MSKDLLKPEENIDLKLSSSLAMMPASAVSALCFANKESKYFAVGLVEKDQVESYAKAKGMQVDECERWLAPILNYERS